MKIRVNVAVEKNANSFTSAKTAAIGVMKAIAPGVQRPMKRSFSMRLPPLMLLA